MVKAKEHSPPRYRHYCNKCIYLGRWSVHDLYACEAIYDGGVCYIARWGDEAHMSANTVDRKVPHSALGAAYDRYHSMRMESEQW